MAALVSSPSPYQAQESDGDCQEYPWLPLSYCTAFEHATNWWTVFPQDRCCPIRLLTFAVSFELTDINIETTEFPHNIRTNDILLTQ